MPAVSKAQYRLMQAAKHDPKFAKKIGINPTLAAEFVSSNVGKKKYSKLQRKKPL